MGRRAAKAPVPPGGEHLPTLDGVRNQIRSGRKEQNHLVISGEINGVLDGICAIPLTTRIGTKWRRRYINNAHSGQLLVSQALGNVQGNTLSDWAFDSWIDIRQELCKQLCIHAVLFHDAFPNLVGKFTSLRSLKHGHAPQHDCQQSHRLHGSSLFVPLSLLHVLAGIPRRQGLRCCRLRDARRLGRWGGLQCCSRSSRH